MQHGKEAFAMNLRSMARWGAHAIQRYLRPKPRRLLVLAVFLWVVALGGLPL